MVSRSIESELVKRFRYFPAIAIVGPRQVGKTTLVKKIQSQISKSTIYLDLELPEDLNKLRDAPLFLEQFTDKTVIIDEVQRMPSLFPVLRSLIDKNREPGRFILLGSASPDLLRTSSESLAGRISYLELNPFNYEEVLGDYKMHWLRGGFPDAYLAPDEDLRFIWFENFIRSYVERDLPLLGLPSNPVMTRRLLTMIASMQGGLMNYSMIGKSLGLSHTTIKKYLDFIESAFLIRTVQPYFVNIGKRLTKNPKIYIQDSGMLHSLLSIHSFENLLGNIIAGNSWEGYVIQNILTYLPMDIQTSFYRTQDGAELDLVLEKGGKVALAVEIKLSNSPTLSRGTTIALSDVGNPPLLVVTPSVEDYQMRENIQVCNITSLKRNLDSFLQ